MITAAAILDVLDAHARAFDFPMPDNAYVEEADMRLTAFRGEEEWLIAFQEVCVFQQRKTMNVVSAYGSHVDGGPCSAAEDLVTPLALPHVRDLDVCVARRRRRLRPAQEQLREAGIEDAGVPPSPIELLRLVCVLLPGELFFDDDELPERCGRPGLQRFLRCDDWRHPDLAADELPSRTPCLRSLAEALAAGDRERYRCPPELHNTHWSHWPRPG